MAKNPHDPEYSKRRLKAILKNKKRESKENKKTNVSKGDYDMTQLTKISYQKEPFEYELKIGWDDEAFVDGSIAFTVCASKRNIETQKTMDNIEAIVSIEKDENNQPILTISDNSELNVTYPLKDLFEESQIIDLIPAAFFGGEPFTGCLIRSGLSTSIAQIIESKNETSGIPWYIERCKAIGSTFISALPDMSGKMARKALRCMIRMGF